MNEKKQYPVLRALVRGAAFALGYYGAKLAFVSVRDWVKNPDREPIIKITVSTCGGTKNAETPNAGN